MKNYLTEWKKYLTEGMKVDAAKKELDLIQKDNQLKLQIAQSKLTNAQAEEKAEEEAKKAAEAQAAAQPENPRLTAGSSSPSTPSPTIAEEQNFNGRADGTIGKTPGNTPDIPNVSNGPKNLALEEDELTEEELEEIKGEHVCMEEGGKSCMMEFTLEEVEEDTPCNECRTCMLGNILTEAKYKGRSVSLNKPMRGDVKKFKVFVRDPSTGNIKKVNFGDKKMRIKKSNPKRRKSFRARHNCANPGPRTKARYWSCRKW
jgi:hypothetical protein